DADGGVGRVDALSTRAGRGRSLDLEVIQLELDLDWVGLGQHRNGRGRRVDAALGFSLRHALDPVHAALGLQLRVGPMTVDLEGDLVVAADAFGRGFD